MTTRRRPTAPLDPSQHWSRRRFLRGVGAAVALPLLPSLTPRGSLASEAVAAVGAPAAPVRLAFVAFPNGCNPSKWWPTGAGETFELNHSTAALASVKQHLQIIAGLDHHNAEAGGDGNGDHARANATLLTGVRARKTAGADIQLGVSVDQVAAERIGSRTRFPSLELSSDPQRQAKGCDSGYACAYQFNVSWRTANTPMPPEANPRHLFERLFGAGTHGERGASYRARRQTQRSILDFVRDDARALRRQLGERDDQKLDEYLTSLREIELRIARAENVGELPDPEVATPVGIPHEIGDHMDLMYDLLLLAFQTDSTRIATLMLGHDGDNRPYPQLGVADGHHNISHHQGRPELVEKITRIDKHQVDHFARFLEKMQATRDLDGGSLLDNSLIVFSSGIGDPNRHTHTSLPTIVAGRAGGRIATGRYHQVPSQPMCNLFLDALDLVGATGVERLGDSTGRNVIV